MRRLLALLIPLGAAALTAACTTSSDPSVPAASGSASASASAGSGTNAPIGSAAWHTGAVAYARCMRQHNVNVPDPAPGQVGWNPEPATARQSPLWGAAWQACQHLLPAGNSPAGGLPTAQQLEQLRTYAVCMRAHGIDMSDPTPTGDTPLSGRLANATRAQVQNDPGFKAAQAACKNKLPGGWLGGKKKNQ